MNADPFYQSLHRDISKFYNEVWGGSGNMKDFHLSKLEEYYRPSRFYNCGNLRIERNEFLTELQDIVNESFWDN